MADSSGLSELARENYARYLRARDAGFKTFVEDALKHDRFYRGDTGDGTHGGPRVMGVTWVDPA